VVTQWWLLSRPLLIHSVENGITLMQYATVHKHRLLKPEYYQSTFPLIYR